MVFVRARDSFFLVGEDRRKNIGTFLTDHKIDNLLLNEKLRSLLIQVT